MLQVETTQIFDATKYLCCAACPLNHNCNKYMLICDYVNRKQFFSANLLCTLERAENACTELRCKLVKEKAGNIAERAKTLYKDFLPAINNFYFAFLKYECENAKEYDKQALIFAMAESLEYYDLLQYYDFMYCQDLENTRNILQASFEYEIQKTENAKAAENNGNENNTTF